MKASLTGSTQVTSKNHTVPMRDEQGWRKQVRDGNVTFSWWLLGLSSPLLVALNSEYHFKTCCTQISAPPQWFS